MSEAASSRIATEMREFLRRVLEKVQPRWIITVERKGTAFLRTAVGTNGARLRGWCGWSQVLSSEVLPAFSESDLKKGPILVVDDSVRTGVRLADAVDTLTKKKHVRPDLVKVAVFAVHEQSSLKPDFRWFGQVTCERYGSIRESILRLFQQEGSLLLDTEHIEVPVELNCGQLEFLDAVCRAGIGVEHVTSDGRINLTIYNPVIFDVQDFLSRLPAGTTIKHAVRKIRVTVQPSEVHV